MGFFFQRVNMTEIESGGPSLIKLGKLANAKDFDKLEGFWVQALETSDYTWRELIPVAGQVGRQGAPDRADALIEMLIATVEEKLGTEEAFAVGLESANQLPKGKGLRKALIRLYEKTHGDFDGLDDLLGLLMPAGTKLNRAVPLVNHYLQLRPGNYVMDLSWLVPGIVETLDPAKGDVMVRFEDRHQEYDLETTKSLLPRPDDFFPALVLYDPDRLRSEADEDSVAFVKMALRSQREGRLMYRELKGHVVNLLGEKGWKSWWQGAKRDLKRDPMIGMSSGSQPTFRLLRQADNYEDRLKREFDFCKDPLEKLSKVLTYLDEISREEKRSDSKDCADNDLLVHFGNGVAKVAMTVLKEDPSLALAGLALHAEIAARGVDVAKPNPKAAAAVLARIADAGVLVSALPEAMLQRVMQYVRMSVPDRWGEVWALVLRRAGKRLCDTITRGLLEGGQSDELEKALIQVVEKPSSSPDLLGWLWRTRHTSGSAGKYLEGLESLPVRRIADAMFSLLDSIGKLYALSSEEKYLKDLESARLALTIQSLGPILKLIDESTKPEAIKFKDTIQGNHGLSPALRTQLLGYLRSRHAAIFIDLTREWEDSSVIYTTEDGLRSLQDALNFIVKEEIPEVAKQIGEAASFGDLSENAEFTAALEKRDQLASRATGLENELKMAVVFSYEMASSDFVNIGTRVTAKSEETGEDEIFTFFGPWDTDVEKKILNYQAPLSMAFMGARVGDRVEFGEDTEVRAWKVIAIEPGI
jgi:transcription elongation GreA/GreB family factor